MVDVDVVSRRRSCGRGVTVESYVIVVSLLDDVTDESKTSLMTLQMPGSYCLDTVKAAVRSSWI